ncbi:Polysaccharide biosynthesis/export protein [Planctomycetes bacterium Poly30]|uniref:Polysaccharide biosynthesis/export protein n=1 Tax=Saltatorellus ferox TaxID=2528018 RepID=A0A518EQG3_9BACT|nr:Polysaccharide biosynthesis/export protein [Planctomycetes bacterium Poly30]
MIRSTVFALTLLLLASSCSTAQGPRLASIAPVINATLRQGENVIEPGDLIQIRLISEDSPGVGAVSTDPAFQLNQDIRVQADGRASFIGLDDMPVAGLLPAVLDEILTGRYTGLLDEEPILSVVVAEQAARTVTVFGEVLRPGLVVVPPDGHLTLVDALGRAGGPSTRTAWLSSTLLVRWDPETETQMAWKIDARRKFWDSEETVILQPRDILWVPNTNIDHIAIAIDNFVRRMIPLPNIVAPIN